MSSWSRPALARQAMLLSIDTRAKAGSGLDGPLDVYALCDELGISVRFVDVGSMEGLYVGGRPPRILIAARRPMARRNYTCAHELGHHLFKHGGTIDELAQDERLTVATNPNEFLAETFAGFLLMPTLGVRKAFADRGWSASTATPWELFTVACSFGVGYTTLIRHLASSLNMLSFARAQALAKTTPARIRQDLFGAPTSAPLLVVDDYWALRTVDAEVGTLLLLPASAASNDDRLVWQADLSIGRLFRATRPGISCLDAAVAGEPVFVRIARSQYVGLSRYRHLSAADNDDEGEEINDS